MSQRESNVSWFLYIIECQNSSLYTGISNDVHKRYAAHCAGQGARYTRMHPPKRLLTVIEFSDRAEASKAEYAFKQLTPKQKWTWCQQYGGEPQTPEPETSNT